MKTSIKLKGIVTEEITRKDNQSQYIINSEGKEYAVVSTGRQAVKDNLFIRKGQQMEIEGSNDTMEDNGKQVRSKKSKIILCKGAEKSYG